MKQNCDKCQKELFDLTFTKNARYFVQGIHVICECGNDVTFRASPL